MEFDAFALKYQHSLFLVVTLFSMGVYESLSGQSHQAHGHKQENNTFSAAHITQNCSCEHESL